MARMETVTCRLREELYSQKQYSMKYNLIFTFDATTDVGKEIEGEDAVSVVRQFLTHVMHVPNANQFCIPVAHRLGGQSGRRRAMLAKFPVATELDLIMRHGNRLRGTRHGVSRQTTPSMAEQNQFAMDTYKEKRSDASNKARLNNGKLYLKGKLQTVFLESRLPDPEPSDVVNQEEVAASNVIKDSGNVFQGFAMTARSPLGSRK